VSPTDTPSPTPTPTLHAGCPNQPELGCFGAGKSALKVKDSLDATKKGIGWKWLKGVAALAQNDFGNPVIGGTSYRVCIYDQTGGVSSFKMGYGIDAGGTCGLFACWKPLGSKGWLYRKLDGNADGITKLAVKGGGAGKPKVLVKGKGVALPLPAPLSGTEFFDQDTQVIIQLHSSTPDNCWSSSFDSSSTKKNDGSQFKAVAQ
jgi:hypothetical protein